MTISSIVQLAEIIQRIQGEAEWEVATQSYPENWTEPKRDLQWYIDANWLIRSGDLIYNPAKNEP